MDLDEFRSFILDSGLDIWTWIDMAISVACADHENELRNRRDGIIQRLYEPAFSRCQNCNFKESEGLEEEEDEDEEKKKILEIKILLDDENQSERSLIDLLQRLVDMDTTFKTLKETDIGRHVSRLRKHSSNEVRRLVKILVRKWKDTVDEWVRMNTPTEEATQFNGDKKSPNEAHHDQSIHNGVKALTPPKEKLKHNQIESDKLGPSTKRPHDQSFQETQHAKKQRTSEIMDFPNIPKIMKNSVVTNNGGSFPLKYW